MTAQDIAVAVLLGLGVAGFALTSIGLVVSDDVYEQIHYLAPGSLIGAVAIPAAVVIREGLSQAGAKAIVIALLLFFRTRCSRMRPACCPYPPEATGGAAK